MPPVERPLFLDQDERRIGEEGRIGSSGFQVHERNLEMDRENQELKRNIERVLRENQLLRERVNALEFPPRWKGIFLATPNGSDGQLERPPKRRLIDPHTIQRRPRPPRRLLDPLEVALSFKA